MLAQRILRFKLANTIHSKVLDRVCPSCARYIRRSPLVKHARLEGVRQFSIQNCEEPSGECGIVGGGNGDCLRVIATDSCPAAVGCCRCRLLSKLALLLSLLSSFAVELAIELPGLLSRRVFPANGQGRPGKDSLSYSRPNPGPPAFKCRGRCLVGWCWCSYSVR